MRPPHALLRSTSGRIRPRRGLFPYRTFSTFQGGSTTSGSTSSTADPPKPESVCNVFQGPSVLRTSVPRPSPSLIQLPGLRSLPFWTRCQENAETRVAYQDPMVTQVVELLESQWTPIRDEYLAKASEVPSDYTTTSSDGANGTEHPLHQGSWDWHSYLLKGTRQAAFAQHFPVTTALLDDLQRQGWLFDGTPFGYAFFSTLHAGSQIQAHSSPINFRLRVHLPLVVPTASTTADGTPACGLVVGPTMEEWREGKALVLDDAFRHEVWNETSESRVLLLVDLWHPDVTPRERVEIVELFQQQLAKQQQQ